MVRFGVPAEVAFDYLVDPANRPVWQSSLKAVADVADDGRSWTDVTKVPGIRPRMILTEAERPHRWSESGQWRGYAAELTLTFEPRGADGCEVTPLMSLTGPGALLLTTLAGPAVTADLRKAAKLLAPHR